MTDLLLNMGLPGLVILAMAWFILRLDARNTALQTKLDEVQSKRIEEAQKIAGQVVELSDVLEKQSQKLDQFLK